MISIYSWDRAAHCVAALKIADLADPALRKDGNRVVWIDLTDPSPADEAAVLQQFLPIHALSLEDVTRLRREPDAPPHLPKVEEFPDYLFVIVNPLTGEFLQHVGKSGNRHNGTARPFTQLSAILTKNILITHHYEPMQCIDQLRAYLQRHGAQADRG